MPNDPATDLASLVALQEGDTTALNRLISRWQRPLINYAYRYVQNNADAHDLVAAVFVRFYQQRAKLRADTNVSAWLFTALTNLCHNHHRWKKRHPTVPMDPMSDENDLPRRPGPLLDLASDLPNPAASLSHDELLDAVRAAVGELPHELKEAMLLHHYQNMSYREISQIAGCSERGVETRLYRARQLLRQVLRDFIHEASSC